MISISLIGDVADEPKFSHETDGKKYFCFPLKVRRLSGFKDHIQAMVRDDLVGSIEIGEKISVSGYIRAYLYHGVSIFNAVALNLEVVSDDTEYLNEVRLSGIIYRKSTLGETLDGKRICSFILKAYRSTGKADYIPAVAWGYNAKRLSSLPEGTEIEIEGRAQTRDAINRDTGKIFKTTEVTVTKMKDGYKDEKSEINETGDGQLCGNEAPRD